MAVIESIMVLYAKEVLTADRVVAAVQRFSHGPAPQAPENHEHGLLLWVCHACEALKKRIDREIDEERPGEGDRLRPPNLPTIKVKILEGGSWRSTFTVASVHFCLQKIGGAAVLNQYKLTSIVRYSF